MKPHPLPQTHAQGGGVSPVLALMRYGQASVSHHQIEWNSNNDQKT
jgi:hypothetical protein